MTIWTRVDRHPSPTSFALADLDAAISAELSDLTPEVWAVSQELYDWMKANS